MKTKVNKRLGGLCPPTPLGFIALNPIPQVGMHARATEAAQACGIWAKLGARVASQRCPILRLGGMIIRTGPPHQQRLNTLHDPAGRMAGFETIFCTSALQLTKS